MKTMTANLDELNQRARALEQQLMAFNESLRQLQNVAKDRKKDVDAIAGERKRCRAELFGVYAEIRDAKAGKMEAVR